MFRSLDPEKIIETLEALSRRIGERFPKTGLEAVARELSVVAHETSGEVARIARPNYVLRAIVGLVIASGLAVLAMLGYEATTLEASTELTNVMQGVDSLFSLLIVFGGAVLYLSTLESRTRREAALAKLHELRSIIHVVDMHQLTKDPSAFGAARTSSSPDRTLTPHQLQRYLGYCSELLSLASKVAALHADKIRDPVVVDAVGDIERLTSNLSQKIWQKIELVQQRTPVRPANDAMAPHAPKDHG